MSTARACPAPNTTRNMMTLDCQHCGAKLAIEADLIPTEVRCRRCGRRTPTTNAKPATQARAAHQPPLPTAGSTLSRPPVAGFNPGDPTSHERRVFPEEIAGSVRPRPGFYAEESVIPSNRGKVALLVGGVAGVLLSVAGAAWWQLAGATRGVQRTTAYVGEKPTVAVSETPQPALRNETSGKEVQRSDAKPARVSEKPTLPPDRPAIPSDARGQTGLAAKIRANANFNPDVYMNSEIALADFERRRLAIPDEDQYDWFSKQFPEGYHLPARIKFAAKGRWLFDNRPVFSVEFFDAPPGTQVKVTLRLPNSAGRKLLDGGQATEREWIHLQADEPSVWWIEATAASDGLPQIPAHWEVAICPRWDVQEVRKMEQTETVDIALDIQYQDLSYDERVQRRINVHPPDLVELGYPNQLGFAGMVDEDHPYITKLLNTINQSDIAKRTGWTASAGSRDFNRGLSALFLVWDELKRRGFRYQSLPGSAAVGCQRVRAIHEQLFDRNANCIDGTVLLCSFFQKMGFESWIAMTPNHAFAVVLVPAGEEENIVALETTQIMSTGTRKLESTVREHCQKLSASEQQRFLQFLAAWDTGQQTFQTEFDLTTKGSGDGKIPSMTKALELLKAGDTAEEQVQALTAFGRYMQIIPISQARAAGIRPIGHNPEALAKYPLPKAP